MNSIRAKLWYSEICRLLGIFEPLIKEFKFNLLSCNSGRITFQNSKYSLHFIYSYDRYQIDREMPMTLISFSDDNQEETIIELLKRLYPTLNVYDEIGMLNSKTNNQDITYLKLIQKYLFPFLESENLFKPI